MQISTVFALATALVATCSGASLPRFGNIVELAASVPDLSTLVTAVKAAGLVDTLEEPGPFTVFAPTNEAFAALPEGVLAKLLKPENKAELVRILTYHVAAGKVFAGQLRNDEGVTMVEGANITIFKKSNEDISIKDGQLRGGLAHITTSDNLASNGIVHIIDKVLIPPTAPPGS
jgi:uncharacterized surface protein with fasciclin (FAS1) repeats